MSGQKLPKEKWDFSCIMKLIIFLFCFSSASSVILKAIYNTRKAEKNNEISKIYLKPMMYLVIVVLTVNQKKLKNGKIYTVWTLKISVSFFRSYMNRKSASKMIHRTLYKKLLTFHNFSTEWWTWCVRIYKIYAISLWHTFCVTMK